MHQIPIVRLAELRPLYEKLSELEQRSVELLRKIDLDYDEGTWQQIRAIDGEVAQIWATIRSFDHQPRGNRPIAPQPLPSSISEITAGPAGEPAQSVGQKEIEGEGLS